MIDGEFIKYLEEAIGRENAAVAFSAFEQPVSVSVRLNPSKFPALRDGSEDVKVAVEEHFGSLAEPVPWSRYGYVLEKRPEFTLDPFFHAGAYYVQDSSAMFVGEAFRREMAGLCGGGVSDMCGYPCGRRAHGGRGGILKVLDLCAAPGGKTTDLAASLREICGENFILVANEVVKDRVNTLSENVARWGDPNVMVTSADPARFAALEGFFDVILADVPCSGEGMFRKDAQAREQWSGENVALCEQRQRRIVADVFPSLRQGGLLIYSTCTFNKYENDGNVKWICGKLGCEIGTVLVADDYDGVMGMECGCALVPGFVSGEGQYCAVLRRCGGVRGNAEDAVPSKAQSASKSRTKHGTVKTGMEKYFDMAVRTANHSRTVVAVPRNIADDVGMICDAVRAVRVGCAVGELRGKDLLPSPDLALSISLAREAFVRVEVDLQTALAYLHRDTVRLPEAPKGYLIITYGGLPLGFLKNLGNRCNNLYPQGRRIRMDVKL